MKLIKAKIENFRSIESMELEFSPSCQILVGINECGKSNILRALRLLSEEFSPKPEDIRSATHRKDWNAPSFVEFHFAMEPTDIDAIAEEIKKSFYTDSDKFSLGKRDGKYVKAKELIADLLKEPTYKVDINSKKKFVYFGAAGDQWAENLQQNLQVLDNWFYLKTTAPAEYVVNTLDGKPLNLVHKSVVDAGAFADLDKQFFAPLNAKIIASIIIQASRHHLMVSLPEVIFWEYSESYLLPSEIPIDSFAADSDLSKPLRNIFEFAGISNISESIAKSKEIRNGIDVLLQKISEEATDYIQEVWKDNKSIEIVFKENGPNIKIGVNNTRQDGGRVRRGTFFDFAERSDGFKRFVTFLFMISARQRSKKLTDALILIDEPEIGLHPSGVKYLLEELISLSENNSVLFSTHSIFMIDSQRISRHLIVLKEDENTTVETARENNLVREELLYRALGTSFLEILRPVNLVFEGWTDKLLFDTALKLQKAAKVRKVFKDVGVCYAEGTENIPKLTQLLQLANRACLVISDADEAGLHAQKRHIEKHGHGEWFLWSDLAENKKFVTAEDFVKPGRIIKAAEETRAGIDLLPELTEEGLALAASFGSALESWLNKAELTGRPRKAAKRKLKEQIFKDLKTSDLLDEIVPALESLADKIG